MNSRLIFPFFLVLNAIALGQKTTDTLYVGKNGFLTKSKAEAVEYRIIEKDYDFEDKGRITVYSAKGEIRSRGEYSSVKNAVLDGEYITYYENGNTRTVETYRNDKLDGQVKSFYRNGRLRRDDLYKQDSLVSGKCFGVNGQDTLHHPFRRMPEYQEGYAGLVKFLVENIRYPKKARKKNITGTVYVSFIVEKDGGVTDLKVVRSPNELLSAEALRVVSLMKSWKPAMEEGEFKRVSMSLPISFRLK